MVDTVAERQQAVEHRTEEARRSARLARSGLLGCALVLGLVWAAACASNDGGDLGRVGTPLAGTGEDGGQGGNGQGGCHCGGGEDDGGGGCDDDDDDGGCGGCDDDGGCGPGGGGCDDDDDDDDGGCGSGCDDDDD
jgi:hypothetical protein